MRHTSACLHLQHTTFDVTSDGGQCRHACMTRRVLWSERAIAIQGFGTKGCNLQTRVYLSEKTKRTHHRKKLQSWDAPMREGHGDRAESRQFREQRQSGGLNIKQSEAYAMQVKQ